MPEKENVPQTTAATRKLLDLHQLDNVSEQPLEVLIGVAAIQAAHRAVGLGTSPNPQIFEAIRAYNAAIKENIVLELVTNFFPLVTSSKRHYMTELNKLVETFLLHPSMTFEELERACDALTAGARSRAGGSQIDQRALEALSRELMQDPDPKRLEYLLRQVEARKDEMRAKIDADFKRGLVEYDKGLVEYDPNMLPDILKKPFFIG